VVAAAGRTPAFEAAKTGTSGMDTGRGSGRDPLIEAIAGVPPITAMGPEAISAAPAGRPKAGRGAAWAGVTISSPIEAPAETV
jgi:hypothetical protein